MKKLIIAVAVLGVATLFTSCKKDYVCECTMDAGGASTTVSYDLKNASKKDAKDACTNYETGMAGVTLKCNLK